MSGRPVGASNRSDLFSSRESLQNQNSNGNKNDAGEFSPNAKQRQLAETYGLGNENSNPNEDPLQLEHILGYSGDFRKTIVCLPGNENFYVKRLFEIK